MRYQDQIVRRTQSALDDVIRAAKAIPSDKVDWSPGGAARSTLAQMREIAQTGDRFLPLIAGDAHIFEGHAAREEAAANGTEGLDDLVSEARSGVARLCQAIMAIPDEDLEGEITLPFGGGMVMTLADALGLPAWNMTYHLGQINQIGLILGDRRMH
ncbi:DinB family protein [bacterium]|nr:MAG: DinB family protein [bacterium]